jgi:pilus assembly protein Flp/PilA
MAPNPSQSASNTYGIRHERRLALRSTCWNSGHFSRFAEGESRNHGAATSGQSAKSDLLDDARYRGTPVVVSATLPREKAMIRLYRYAKKQIDKLRQDESGATMIEYSVLIGLITVAIIVAVTTVGTWIGTQWTNLAAAL